MGRKRKDASNYEAQLEELLRRHDSNLLKKDFDSFRKLDAKKNRLQKKQQHLSHDEFIEMDRLRNNYSIWERIRKLQSRIKKARTSSLSVATSASSVTTSTALSSTTTLTTISFLTSISSSTASSVSTSVPMTREDFERKLANGEYDQETHALFLELVCITDRMAEAGFADSGRLMIRCRLYDALLEVDPESLNQHGKRFIVDNDSNRQLYEDYKDAWICAHESWDRFIRDTSGVIPNTFDDFDRDDIPGLSNDPRFEFYYRVPDLSPYLINSRKSLSSHSSSRSSYSSSTSTSISSDVKFIGNSRPNSRPTTSSSSSSSGVLSEVVFVDQRSSVGAPSSTLPSDGSISYTGLRNFGNTCYLNSTLQMAFHTVPIRKAILDANLPPIRVLAENMRSDSIHPNFGVQHLSLDYDKYAAGLIQLQNLFRLMSEPASSSRVIDPGPFINAFSFNRQVQEEVYEIWDNFIIFFLRYLDVDESILQSWSEVGDAYYSITALCRDDVWSLDELFQVHDKLHGGIMPPVLMIRVDRSYQLERNGTIVDTKLTQSFRYPDSLDASDLCSGSDSLPINYRLRSFVVHSGNSIHSGHYRTFVRNFHDSEWVELNDSTTKKVASDSSEFVELRGKAVLLQYIHIDHVSDFEDSDKSLCG